jgi:HPt (histidine-containing phosphotransfer) domain-containing protein
LELIRKGIEQQDADTLFRSAHKLKSGSADMGARQLSAVCRHLETMGRQKRLDRASELLDLAESNYVIVRDALSAYRVTAPAPRSDRSPLPVTSGS